MASSRKGWYGSTTVTRQSKELARTSAGPQRPAPMSRTRCPGRRRSRTPSVRNLSGCIGLSTASANSAAAVSLIAWIQTMTDESFHESGWFRERDAYRAPGLRLSSSSRPASYLTAPRFTQHAEPVAVRDALDVRLVELLAQEI